MVHRYFAMSPLGTLLRLGSFKRWFFRELEKPDVLVPILTEKTYENCLLKLTLGKAINTMSFRRAFKNENPLRTVDVPQ
ncbi:hypothetical protein SAMN05216404_108149 [Nitrosospira multiformis]|uniref:Uncharacterized protein n=1 Tax=Nitrosospira multiformis TaxID=1231 RepID=A0A1H8KI78_9PROT|nr:hypothetical protein SAMN05216404_108149 [Nitrosospira multiformis]